MILRRRARKRVWAAAAVLLLILVAAATRQMKKANAATTLPTTRVRRGEFGVIVRCRGEITARRSVQLSAPVNIPDLKIVWLAPAGAFVKSGEPVVRFDPSSARQQLNEKQAVLEHAQAALDQAIAQARITAEQGRRRASLLVWRGAFEDELYKIR